MSRSSAKQHAAERAVRGDVRSGEYVYYQGPTDFLEVKLYAPWRSYQPTAEEARLARKIRQYDRKIASMIEDELRHV